MLLGCERFHFHCPCNPENAKLEIVRIDVENLARLGKDNLSLYEPAELLAIDSLISEYGRGHGWSAKAKEVACRMPETEGESVLHEPERSHADARKPLQRSQNTQSDALRKAAGDAVLWSEKDIAVGGPASISFRHHRVFNKPLNGSFLAYDVITEASEEDEEDEEDEEKEESITDFISNEKEQVHIAGFVQHFDRQELAHDPQQAEEDPKDELKLREFLAANGFKGVNVRRTRMLKWKYPLHTAVKQRDAKLVELLLKSKADPALKSSAGVTPMELAQKINRNGSHTAVLHACPPVSARTPSLDESTI